MLSSLFLTLPGNAVACYQNLQSGLDQVCSRLLRQAVHSNALDFVGQRSCLPYYCSHILGSLAYYVSDSEKAKMADRWLRDGTIAQLVRLHSGDLSWIEQRAASRALENLTHSNSSLSASQCRVQEEIVFKHTAVEDFLYSVFEPFKTGCKSFIYLFIYLFTYLFTYLFI